MTTRRPAWPISEAADLTGVSRSTIRRHREAGRFPNAYKDSSGSWRIPLEDLLAVGLRPIDPALTESEPERAVAATIPKAAPVVDEGLAQHVRDLESALAAERARADSAERIAALAEANAADLRMALRMLEAGRMEQREPVSALSEQAQPEPVSTVSEQAQPEQPRSSWWRRLLGE